MVTTKLCLRLCTLAEFPHQNTPGTVQMLARLVLYGQRRSELCLTYQNLGFASYN